MINLYVKFSVEFDKSIASSILRLFFLIIFVIFFIYLGAFVEKGEFELGRLKFLPGLFEIIWQLFNTNFCRVSKICKNRHTLVDTLQGVLLSRGHFYRRYLSLEPILSLLKIVTKKIIIMFAFASTYHRLQMFVQKIG